MDGFNLIQSVLAVTQYVGSFLGVIVTAQLRQATHSFVAPFAVFPVLGTLVTAHCCRVYAREGGSWEGGGGGGTRRAYVRTS